MILQSCLTSAHAPEDMKHKLVCKFPLENVISLNKESLTESASADTGCQDQQQILTSYTNDEPCILCSGQ